MSTERDFVRTVYALALDLHDAGLNVVSVRVNGSESEAKSEVSPPPPPPRPVIWYHGGQGYSLDSDPISVTEEEHKVLQAFVAHPTAMKKSELMEAAELENVARVLTGLTERYAGVFKPAIRRPARKGKGGYFIRVLPVADRKSPST